MKIDSSGILCSAKIDSNKACYTFSSFVSLSNGSILATARGGNNKDSELEGIEFFRSDDEGEKWSEPWEPFKNVKIDNLKGSLKLCYLTEISDSHIIASFLWMRFNDVRCTVRCFLLSLQRIFDRISLSKFNTQSSLHHKL